MPKQKSRPKRWAEAIETARAKMEEIDGLASDLADALSELKDIQDEYEEWRNNLPENLEQSALADKLDEIMNLDIESYMGEPLSNWDEVENVLGEAENADLPLGFGRD